MEVELYNSTGALLTLVVVCAPLLVALYLLLRDVDALERRLAGYEGRVKQLETLLSKAEAEQAASRHGDLDLAEQVFKD